MPSMQVLLNLDTCMNKVHKKFDNCYSGELTGISILCSDN